MWVELKVPAPPRLAELCGYPEGVRYVGLCWQPCGDECEFDDGRTSGTGSWGPYLAFTQHRAVAPELAPFNLGSSDCEPKEMLIIDRQEGKVFVADVRTGREFLRRQQHPPLPELTGGDTVVTLADVLDLSKWREVVIDQDEITARMRQEAEQTEEMLRFLDSFVRPRP